MKSSNFDFAPKSSPRFAINWSVERGVVLSSCANITHTGVIYDCQRSICGETNGILAPNDHSIPLHTFSYRHNSASQPSSILSTPSSKSRACRVQMPLAIDGPFEGGVGQNRNRSRSRSRSKQQIASSTVSSPSRKSSIFNAVLCTVYKSNFE